ncbi:DUF6544 family protein [Nonomuraea dietziae]|uniref:DUF6544 family protein n=1 Tax=Nonomuraea dietziae TaxID=65515 RepID=UPI003419D267
MSVIVAPPRLTDSARLDWNVLQAPTPDPRPFDPADAEMLPEPARRWLLHAVRPGTPLRRSVVLRSHGAIKLGSSWRGFHARQVLAPLAGYVWAANTLLVNGFDRYRDGSGEMRWRLLDLIPVRSSSSPDTACSALGRLASEFVMVPAVALDPSLVWKPVDERHVIARLHNHDITLTIAVDGRLESVSLSRWHEDRYERFTADCSGEITCDGFTIPSDVRGSWDEEDFIWFTVDEAVFR